MPLTRFGGKSLPRPVEKTRRRGNEGRAVYKNVVKTFVLCTVCISADEVLFEALQYSKREDHNPVSPARRNFCVAWKSEPCKPKAPGRLLNTSVPVGSGRGETPQPRRMSEASVIVATLTLQLVATEGSMVTVSFPFHTSRHLDRDILLFISDLCSHLLHRKKANQPCPGHPFSSARGNNSVRT